MKRISTSTKVADKFGPGKHGYTDGNAGGGIVPTDLEADLFDHIQEELCAIVEAAGIAVDGSARNQLLTALRSAGLFQTPPQFDNSTKAATTAFVKKAGMQASGLTLVTASGPLAVTVIGGTVAINAAAATTQTLPAANSVPSGARIELVNINNGTATIQRAGADTVVIGNGSANSLPLTAGSTLTLESDGANKWYAVGGTAVMSCFYAWQSVAQTIAAATWVAILWQTAVFDDLGEFNGATGVFTAKNAGTYEFTLGIHIAGSTTRSLEMYVNGASFRRIAENNPATSGETSASTGPVRLNAGDTVAFYINTASGGTTSAVQALSWIGGKRSK